MSANVEPESPPRDEIGSAVGTVEPKAKRSARGRAVVDDTAHSSPAVKRTNELAEKAEAERRALIYLSTGAHAAYLKIADFAGEQPLDVIRRGDSWELHFWGHGGNEVVVIDGGENLLAPRKVEAAFLCGLGTVLSLGSRDAWRPNAQAIVNAARTIKACTEEDETRALVLQVISGSIREDDRAEIDKANGLLVQRITLAGTLAWREGEEIYVRLPNLLSALRKDGIRNMTMRTLSARMGRIGFEDDVRRVRADATSTIARKGEQVRARVWTIDRADLLIDDDDDGDE